MITRPSGVDITTSGLPANQVYLAISSSQTTALVRTVPVRPQSVMRLRRMAGSAGRTAADGGPGERQQWAAREGDPAKLDFDSFCDGQRVLKLNANIPHGPVHFGVPEQ